MSTLITEHMALVAEFLAENPGFEPHEVGPLELAVWTVRRTISGAADFELSASNKDRPDAERYGTFADGSPRHAPEWYAVHGAATGAQERLYGALRVALICHSTNDDGHGCIGGIGHHGNHHDGQGANW